MVQLSDIVKDIEYSVKNMVSIKDIGIAFVVYDSRKAFADTLFVCLVGQFSDGHNYALSAYSKGCRAFLCERPLDLPADAVQILVKDTRAALAYVSAAFFGYPARELKIIGITGTKGKTTTALLATSILNKAGHPAGYIGSNGVYIGDERIETNNTTPESCDLHYFFRRMVNAGMEYAVIEVSSQALLQGRVRGVSFYSTVFLNLYTDHIGPGEHRDFDDYRDCKRKLFADYVSQQVIYNADDPFSLYMVENSHVPTMSFGLSENADLTACNLNPYRDETSLGIEFDCRFCGETCRIRVKSPGDFSAHNALAAIAICSEAGVSFEKCSALLADCTVEGRFEVVDALDGRIFIIDYAHNGISIARTTEVLRDYCDGRLIVVVGSVGGRTYERRGEIGAYVSQNADLCILTADNPDFEPVENIIADIRKGFVSDIPWTAIPDRADAVRYAADISQAGDIVLLAGKGTERYQLIEGEKRPFVERDILLDEAAKIKAGTPTFTELARI